MVTSSEDALALNALHEFCRDILESPSLEAKLRPAEATLHASIEALHSEAIPSSSAPLIIDRPAREPGLSMGSQAGPLPRPGELKDPNARATCLARFAHHELMAIELFAWALLRWPDLPIALQPVVSRPAWRVG